MRSCCRIVCLLTVLASLCMVSVYGDEPAENDITARRNELMTSKVLAFDVTSTVDSFPKAFEGKPIFRYNDPARSYVAAAIWKLGDCRFAFDSKAVYTADRMGIEIPGIAPDGSERNN